MYADALRDVQLTFPNLLKFSISNSRTQAEQQVSPEEILQQQSMEELFEDFYRYMNADVPPTEEHEKIFRQILTELEGADHETD